MPGLDDCPAGDPAECPLQRRAEDPRWSEMTGRMDAFEEALQANTEITRDIKSNTDEIIAFFQSGKGFFRAMAMIGAGARWVLKVSAALAVVWAVFRYGVMEAINDLKDGGGK